MRVVSLTSDLAKRLGIPEAHSKALRDEIMRLIQDGRQALDKNSDAPESVCNALTQCEGCSCVTSEEAFDALVCDADAWAQENGMSGCPSSADVLLLLEGDGYALQFVEGKLGIVCRYPGDRGGTSIRLVDLERKWSDLLGRLPEKNSLARRLILLVPRDGQEWAWYKVRNWNLRNNKIGKILSCCLSDFIRLLTNAKTVRPIECQRPINAYRFNLLSDEISSLGPMRQVQLPGLDVCTACGKCRDACRHQAITLALDDETGTKFYPFVDKRSCKSGCRHCESVCPILTQKGAG